MQNLELILIVISTTYILFHIKVNERFDKKHIIGLLTVVLATHLIFNGFRLQMIPGYLIWIIALITAIRQPQQKSSLLVSIMKYLGLAIILAVALALPSLFPVFDLPKPTGSYTVGTEDILLELNREEKITPTDGDKRTLMIKTWYPSNDTEGKADTYIDKGGRNGFAQKYGLPNAMFDYLDKVETNVYRNAEIAEEKFPVLIFSHGYNSKANGYYALLSELASHGYVIFAINHTYESTGTTFPDGKEVYFDYEYGRKIESGTFETVTPTINAFKDGLSFEERHPIVRKALLTYFVRDMVERWAEDIVDVVDQLEGWNSRGFYAGRLDLSNIGAFGHSRGGGGAGEALRIDNRIKAGSNVDGVQWGQIVDTVFHKPFLFIASDWSEDKELLGPHAYVNKSTSYFYEVLVRESGHSTFMDIPFMIPVSEISLAGDIDPDMGMEISRNVITSFFDKHLKNRNIDLSQLDSEYDLLDLKVYKGDSVISGSNNIHSVSAF